MEVTKTQVYALNTAAMWNCFISAFCFCSAEHGKEVSAVCAPRHQQWLVGHGVWGGTRCESLPLGYHRFLTSTHASLSRHWQSEVKDYSACEMLSSLEVRRLSFFNCSAQRNMRIRGKTERMGPSLHVHALFSASRIVWESEKLWALLKHVFCHPKSWADALWKADVEQKCEFLRDRLRDIEQWMCLRLYIHARWKLEGCSRIKFCGIACKVAANPLLHLFMVRRWCLKKIRLWIWAMTVLLLLFVRWGRMSCILTGRVSLSHLPGWVLSLWNSPH